MSSLKLRAAATTGSFLAVAAGALAIILFSSVKTDLTAESMRRVALELDMLADMTAGPLHDHNTGVLAEIADHTARDQHGRVCVVDVDGRIMVDSSHLAHPRTRPVITKASHRMKLVIRKSSGRWEAAEPVIENPSRFEGVVYMSVSTEPLDRQLRHITIIIAAFATASIVGGGLVAYLFGGHLSGLFTPMLSAIRRSEAGDLPSRMPEIGVSELDELGRAYNHMASIVEQRMHDLEGLNRMGNEVSAARSVRDLASVLGRTCGAMVQAECTVLVGDPASGVMRVAGEDRLRRIADGSASYIAWEERRPLIIGAEGDLPPGAEIAEDMQAQSAVVAPLVAPSEGTVGVIMLQYEPSAVPSPHRRDSANVAAVASVAAPALAAVLRAEAQEQAVAALRHILIPESAPQLDGAQVYAHFEPAEKPTGFGGDYYDFMPLQDGVWGIAIGDVSGKGLDAGRYTAMARYVVRSYAVEYPDTAQTMTHANEALTAQMGGLMFITIFFARLDLNARRLSYCRAGHPPGMLYSREKGMVTELSVGGGAVGIFENASFQEGSVSVNAGDVIVLYTDGITEARRPGGQYGAARLKAVVAANAEKDLRDAAANILEDVNQFSGGRFPDDRALVLIRLTSD